MKTFIVMHVALSFFVLQRLCRVGPPRPFAVAPVLLDYAFTAGSIFLRGAISGVVVVGLKVFLDTSLPFIATGLIDDWPPLLQGSLAFLAIDFTAYWSHRIRHKIEWLWYFHAVHHSQRTMNPLANMRFHPFDLVTDTVLRAAPMLVLGGSYSTWFWFSVVDYLWGYFVHADVRIDFGLLKYFIVTPQYHRVHHSLERRHFDMNFSDRLTLWDWLFGTMYRGFDEYPDTGVDGYPVEEAVCRPGALLRAYLGHAVYPFRMIYRSVRPKRLEATGQSVLPSI